MTNSPEWDVDMYLLFEQVYKTALNYEEQFFMNDKDYRETIQNLERTISSITSDPDLSINDRTLLEIIYLLKLLQVEQDEKAIPEIIGLIDRIADEQFWHDKRAEIYILFIITELIEAIVSFKRKEDIEYLTNIMTWDFYQIPSQVLLLARRYAWIELWDAINKRYDLSGEYDLFVRAQFFHTRDIVDAVLSSNNNRIHGRRNKEIDALANALKASNKPVIYVEGKTDRIILNNAWNKLYENKIMSFSVKDCDPLGSEVAEGIGGAGGAGTLLKFISTVRSDSPHLAIAIFDRDKEGIDAYQKLPSYFRETKTDLIKVADHKKAAALLLPIPSYKEKYAENLNLYIEFYFDETVLSKKTKDGWGLEFRYPQIEVRVRRQGNPLLEIIENTFPETREIIGGKTIFAEQIVPTLDKSEFVEFEALFSEIISLIENLEGKLSTDSST